MKHILLGVTLVVVVLPCAALAQTVTSIGTQNVAAADDFATRAFQDPWDMNERTDLGWFLHGSDQPGSGFSTVNFSGGEFIGTSTQSTNVFLLDTGNPNAARLGKVGLNYPIDADKYKIVAFRMSSGVSTTDNVQFVWNRETIYDNTGTNGHNVQTTNGYRIYVVDMTSLATLALGSGGPIAWSGLIKSLSMNLNASNRPGSGNIRMDWVRLVSVDSTLCRAIEWSGFASNVDIYLDNDTNAANGNLGPIALNASGTSGNTLSASAGCSTSGNGYKFYAGALTSGTYRIVVVGTGVAPTSATFANYSPTTWVVDDIPTLTFTSPSPEGSSDDFATTFLNDPWDMNKLSDVDLITNINSPQITSLAVETPAGASLGTQTVFRGTSAPAAAGNVGDPYVDPLFVTVRGAANRIDTTRYRIATIELGIPNKARSILNGSIARIVWRVAGVAGESVSDDIIFNHRTGANVLDKIVVDMADRSALKIEQGAFAGGQGWINGSSSNPGLDIFRVDPHEFSDPTDFYINRVKLAALERTRDSYTIRWTYSETSGTVDLYYSTSALTSLSDCSSGNLIQNGISATAGQHVWDTSGLGTAAGTNYYICAVFSDGTNSNQAFAKWPVVIDSDFVELPRIVLNRSRLNFGITNLTTKTSAQTVRVSIVGSGSPCWTVANSLPSTFIVDNPSGCGNGSFTVRLVDQNYVALGVGAADFTVTASGVDNSPQTVQAVFRIWGSTTGPRGLVDTPAEAAVVRGSIAVTGWAVDDIEIATVKVFRNPTASEGLAPVFVGDAVRSDDSRPDVEAGNPDNPFNYRAGWGYLLLTNFLPNLGDGSYTLYVYATDREGNQTLLGTKNIVGANSASEEPFGAIDTPGQGATVAGTVANFGWVLVRGPARADPPSGGAVSVFVDGLNVGSPGGWTSRSDLTSLFPASTYPGVVNALGVYSLNTTAYANGVHTISWLVVANNTQAAGIGSRFFTIFNTSGGLTTASAGTPDVIGAPPQLNPGPNLGRRARDVGAVDAAAPVRASRGYAVRPAMTTIEPDLLGVRTVHGSALGRTVVDVSAPGVHRYEAYLVAGGVLRPLPIGAAFNERRGVLYWQPAIGYTGAYDFVIVRDGATRVPVRVILGSAPERRPAASRFVRDLFTSAN